MPTYETIVQNEVGDEPTTVTVFTVDECMYCQPLIKDKKYTCSTCFKCFSELNDISIAISFDDFYDYHRTT